MKNQNSSLAIITTVLIIFLLIIIIKVIRHFSNTTTTTTTPSSLSLSPQPNHQSDQHNQNLINSLPTFRFESIKGIPHSTSFLSSTSTAETTANLDCAICISKFENQDPLRLLPSCCHVFHSVCIDQWILLSNYYCPICKSDVKFSVDDGDLRIISSSSRSFRIEIGSVSHSSRTADKSFAASDLQNRSYSLLESSEYLVQDLDAEIFLELERIDQNRAQSGEVSISAGGAAGGYDGDEAVEIVIENPVPAESDETSISVGGAAGGDDGDEAVEIVIENPVPAESDEAASYTRSLSYTSQFSDRSGGGMDVGGGGGGGRVWDLEGNRFGEEISGFFDFLSRI
ncbi:hypothetical protein MKW92_040345 [Papaver armeniacum]|nr:hypothetical protein MKW92_040345 [Papaver armeniacum]